MDVKASGSFTIIQLEYVATLEDKLLHVDAVPSLRQVKTTAGALGWHSTQTRIDLASGFSIMNHANTALISLSTTTLFNSAILSLLALPSKAVILKKMDAKNMISTAYRENGLAADADLSSQKGGFFFIRDKDGSCRPCTTHGSCHHLSVFSGKCPGSFRLFWREKRLLKRQSLI